MCAMSMSKQCVLRQISEGEYWQCWFIFRSDRLIYWGQFYSLHNGTLLEEVVLQWREHESERERKRERDCQVWLKEIVCHAPVYISMAYLPVCVCVWVCVRDINIFLLATIGPHSVCMHASVLRLSLQMFDAHIWNSSIVLTSICSKLYSVNKLRTSSHHAYAQIMKEMSSEM